MNEKSKPTILVTGGLGYIGSHTVIELISNGYEVVIVDNLSNSSAEVLNRIEEITSSKITLYIQDLEDEPALANVFKNHSFESVIHFAGLKAVGESVIEPLKYYSVNIGSTLSLINTMHRAGVHKLIFSSSATVYGSPKKLPIDEQHQVGVGLTNAYGKSKYFVEEFLRDISASDNNFSFTILRYFNPVGAHTSGLIGENPNGTPNNLLPYVSQVAIGKQNILSVFGNDYDTFDGTGVRDYIHVTDLALGHIAALKKMKSGVSIYNLGTGKGTSVLELITAFEKASGVKIPYKILERRTGDIAECYSDPSIANNKLKWKATKTIDDACVDTWKWQQLNPNGINS